MEKATNPDFFFKSIEQWPKPLFAVLYIWGLYDPGIVRSQYKDSYKTNQYNKRMSWGFCCRRSIFVLRMSEVSTKNSVIRNFGYERQFFK